MSNLSTGQKRQPKATTTILKVFELLLWYADLQKKQKVVGPLVNAVVILLLIHCGLILLLWHGIDLFHNPTWWPQHLSGHGISASLVTKFLVTIIFTIFFQVVGKGLIPVICYVPQSIAMRSLGLKYVLDDPFKAHKLARELRDNKHTKSDRVKVICISGKYLFRDSIDSKHPPLLQELAKQGKVEVLMPKSSSYTSTVKLRFETYSADFKERTGINNVVDLVKEVDDSKKALEKNGNIVHEHDALCMWRVILFSEHCLVQNYFPNSSGADSFKAPMVVFEKAPSDDSYSCYYHTFEKMFEFLKQQNSKPDNIE